MLNNFIISKLTYCNIKKNQSVVTNFSLNIFYYKVVVLNIREPLKPKSDFDEPVCYGINSMKRFSKQGD